MGSSGRVWLGWLLLLLIGGAPGAMAIVWPDSVANLVAYAWGGMGAAFGPPLLLALYWRRFNFWGALASIIAGTLAVTAWHLVNGGPWGVFDVEIAATPGFVVAMASGVVATLVTPASPAKLTARFDSAVGSDPREGTG